MCIICEIKSLNPSPEILAKVETLGRALVGVLDACGGAIKRNEKTFEEAEMAAIVEAETLFVNKQALGLGALLAAVLGGVKVENVVTVEVGEGESLSDAIARTLAANEASSGAFTKH